MMLTRREGQRCEFSRVGYWCNIMFCDFVNFCLTCTDFASSQASLPFCSMQPPEPDVVTVSSSDTEEALELLSLSPCCDLASLVSDGNVREPSSSSGSELFED
jgi:hypothetical protein